MSEKAKAASNKNNAEITILLFKKFVSLQPKILRNGKSRSY